MITQRDMQAAYEYGVKLAYEHLQKSAEGPSQTAMFHDGGAAYNAAHQPPPPPPPAAAERGISQMSAEEIMEAIKNRGSGFMDELKGLRSTIGIPNAPQMSEIASRGYGAANSVADRFLSHMGRHPAAYGLGAAGLGAAGLTGLGLGIGNAVHNSRD